VNKFQKIGLVVVFALSMSFAKQILWNASMPGGQVQFPWIQDCWNAGGDETNSEDPCYKELGGWWFGFVTGPNMGAETCEWADPRQRPGAQSSDQDYVKAKIDGTFRSIVGPDYDGGGSGKCEGPAISNLETGASLLDGGVLEVQLSVGPGITGGPWDPDIAAISVNLNTPPHTKETNIGAMADGFYLTYESDHTASHDLAFELGWDEDIYNYDTWLAPIKPGSGVQTQEFKFAWESEPAGGTKLKAGDFEQEGWSYAEDDAKHGNDGSTEYGNSIKTAISKMQAVKIRLKGMTANKPAPITFKIIEFGFLDKTSPIVKKAAQNVAKFNLQGKMLSLSSVEKPVSVQIINLQGALVHTQTLASGSINLSHLPSGVYIVRAPAIGYSGRIMLK
jgi:hypothetical protein